MTVAQESLSTRCGMTGRDNFGRFSYDVGVSADLRIWVLAWEFRLCSKVRMGVWLGELVLKMNFC
jgi:hypothetical protein